MRKVKSPIFGSPLVVVTFVYRIVYSWVNLLMLLLVVVSAAPLLYSLVCLSCGCVVFGTGTFIGEMLRGLSLLVGRGGPRGLCNFRRVLL